MKRTISIILAALLTLCVCASFSGCNLFATMRQNAEQAAQTTLLDTPDDEKSFEQLTDYINSAFDNAEKLGENISYSVAGIKVMKDGEDAGLLDDAASMLKTFIMNGKPGAQSRDITDKADAGLLLSIDKSSALNYEITRNTQSEKVTDEDGNQVTLEDGENVTEIHTVDNCLNYVIEYFATQTVTDENGEEKEEYTPADDATIKAVFGEDADKNAVIANFDCVADYLKLNDYTFDYGNCTVKASVDMELGQITGLEFGKKLLVKANVTGQGALAEYGELTVEFELTKNTSYSFAYPVEEEII